MEAILVSPRSVTLTTGNCLWLVFIYAACLGGGVLGPMSWVPCSLSSEAHHELIHSLPSWKPQKPESMCCMI